MAHEDTSNLNLNSTKSSARPSSEALEEHTGDATDAGKTEQQKMDRVAMESAKRGENRLLADEGNIPGSTLISK